MRIYYCREPYNEWTDEPVPNWPRDYDLVADIDQGGLVRQEALEKAFRKTQNHGGNWTSHEGVKAFKPECRSMYPGDVVALDDGELYRCEASGWSHIATLWPYRTDGAITPHLSYPIERQCFDALSYAVVFTAMAARYFPFDEYW